MRDFRRPMDAENVNQRLAHSNDIYSFAVAAAGEQGSHVDRLSWALKQCLPSIVAALAAEISKQADG